MIFDHASLFCFYFIFFLLISTLKTISFSVFLFLSCLFRYFTNNEKTTHKYRLQFILFVLNFDSFSLRELNTLLLLPFCFILPLSFSTSPIVHFQCIFNHEMKRTYLKSIIMADTDYVFIIFFLLFTEICKFIGRFLRMFEKAATELTDRI